MFSFDFFSSALWICFEVGPAEVARELAPRRREGAGLEPADDHDHLEPAEPGTTGSR